MIKNILYVEDGSVDFDKLEEALSKETLIIPYRQGAREPILIQIPTDTERLNDLSEQLRVTRDMLSAEKHRADVAEEKIAELTEENEKLSAELETAIKTRIVLFDKMKKYMDNSPIWEAENIIKLIETEEKNYYNRYFYIKIMDNAGLSLEDHRKVHNKIIEHFGERENAI